MLKFFKSGAKLPKMVAHGAHVGKLSTTDFAIADNGTGTATIFGLDSATPPQLVDISAVATASPPPTSSDPTKLTVGAPTGMTFPFAGVAPTVPGTPVVVTAGATWNDGSVGPFTGTQAFDVTGSKATGITITPVANP